MRTLTFVLGAALLAGCAKKEPAPEPAPPPPPPAPAPINLADVAGTWTVKTMPAENDSVIVTYTLAATAADTGWMMTLPGRKAMPVRVMVMGDSVMTTVGPYESVLRKGVKVSTESVFHLSGGKLMGTTVAHYTVATADSVRRLRNEGTKNP